MTKRPSLSTFAPGATGAKVVHETTTPAPAPAMPATSVAQYPKLSVYLTKEEIRTLKLIGIDSGQKVSDICATAIREWLARNGHARTPAA